VTSRSHGGVVVVGSINADSSYVMPELPAPGETVLSTARLNAPGGKGANQAAALAAIGVPVSFVGAIGTDDSGTALVQGLAERGVDISQVSSVDSEPTGSAVILVSASGENSIVVHPGANSALGADHVRQALELTSPSIVLAQLEIPLEAVAVASETAGATFILNPAPMPPVSPLLQRIIAATDILVPNRTELASLAGSPTPTTLDEVVSLAKSIDFPGALVVTLGHEGALVFPEGVSGPHEIVPAPQVTAVDTSGAGDAFCAALAAGLSRGESLVVATAAACEFAAWTTTQRGAQVPQSPPAELLRSA
jgi:ribokinase